MRRIFIVALMAAASALAQAPAEDLRKLAAESRKVADDLVARIRIELVRELDASGPLKAVVVCKYIVPEITSNISRRTGWRVSRVSLRPRNPALASPDAWEQKVLLDFERRQARGEKPETLEHMEIVTEPAGRYFRYMKAIPLAPQCEACHGPPGNLSQAQRTQLAHEYPFDKAIGSTSGELRGATTVKRPL